MLYRRCNKVVCCLLPAPNCHPGEAVLFLSLVVIKSLMADILRGPFVVIYLKSSLEKLLFYVWCCGYLNKIAIYIDVLMCMCV